MNNHLLDTKVNLRQVNYITVTVVDPADKMLVLLSELFDWPIQQVEIKEQVGRFILLRYRVNLDPEIVLCIGSNRERREFNSAIARLQEVRRGSPCYPREWRHRAVQAAAAVKKILATWAYPDEQVFVENWVDLVVATMSTVQDGVKRLQEE